MLNICLESKKNRTSRDAYMRPLQLNALKEWTSFPASLMVKNLVIETKLIELSISNVAQTR